MKKWIMLVLMMGAFSSFAKEVHCTDQAKWTDDNDPDISKFNLITSGGEGRFELVRGLMLVVTGESNRKITLIVGKNVSFAGGGAWNPLVISEGKNEVKLFVNKNSLAKELYYSAYDFPQKKMRESKDEFSQRLRKYLEEMNDKPLIDSFEKKYDELAMIHCKYMD